MKVYYNSASIFYAIQIFRKQHWTKLLIARGSFKVTSSFDQEECRLTKRGPGNSGSKINISYKIKYTHKTPMYCTITHTVSICLFQLLFPAKYILYCRVWYCVQWLHVISVDITHFICKNYNPSMAKRCWLADLSDSSAVRNILGEMLNFFVRRKLKGVFHIMFVVWDNLSIQGLCLI